MKNILFIAAMVVLMAGGAQAASVGWDGGGIGSDWNNATNWVNDVLPGTSESDVAVIIFADAATVTGAVTSAFGVNIAVRNATVDTSLAIKADMNSLIKIDLSVAGDDGKDNKIAHSAGTVTVSGNANIGGDAGATGTYIQTGGALNAGGVIVSAGGVYQSSESVKARSLTTSSMTVKNGGAVILSGTAVQTIVVTNLTVGDLGVGTFTQNATNRSVTIEGLNVGTNGLYDLIGGTLMLAPNTGATIGGLLDINGGTLTTDLELTHDIGLNGVGILRVQDGVLSKTNGSATEVIDQWCRVEISGGSVNIEGQCRLRNEFKVIGGEASIDIDRCNVSSTNAHFIFELDETGGSTINALSYQDLERASLTVDGSNYTGGDTNVLLFDSPQLTEIDPVNITVMGFSSQYAVDVEQDISSGKDWVQMQTIKI